jgi:hypothetical protein
METNVEISLVSLQVHHDAIYMKKTWPSYIFALIKVTSRSQSWNCVKSNHINYEGHFIDLFQTNWVGRRAVIHRIWTIDKYYRLIYLSICLQSFFLVDHDFQRKFWLLVFKKPDIFINRHVSVSMLVVLYVWVNNSILWSQWKRRIYCGFNLYEKWHFI